MKFTLVAFAAAVLIAVAQGGSAPIPEDQGRCSYNCLEPDTPVCASNGACIDNFSSLCKLQTYNCLNPQKQFQQLPDHKCKESGQPICTKGDFQ